MRLTRLEVGAKEEGSHFWAWVNKVVIQKVLKVEQIKLLDDLRIESRLEVEEAQEVARMRGN